MAARGGGTRRPGGDPQWYRDAVLYELHVRAFQDSDGDGAGDFPGLTSRLDYLQDLGVTALWLLPFYPSPLRDDGYDIANYKGVHPDYGTLGDFREFLREAHRRGLRVITELVLNHTSDLHPWFQRARRAAPGSIERDFYVWSDDPRRYEGARVIFQDFEPSNWTWDDTAGAYYWHRFYRHQPDLNFESPAVRAKILGIVDFWMRMGVDGLRLDGVPYLYEEEGTNCENLPQTHAFLRELRRHVDRRWHDRVLLAEANQWPEDAAAYFGRGDECHMAFQFPLMPRLFLACHTENRTPILDILERIPVIPDGCQWALFLRNHDELTLEMVTDEERDSMVRFYARDPKMRLNLGIRRRLATLLENDRRQIELLLGLLCSLPGTPVLYYGDEIGMGDNIYLGDRDGVRTPMQWSPDRNAGFSKANPQKLYLPVILDPAHHYEAVNVEAELRNPHSLLWWTRRLLGLRRRWRVFGRGSLEVVHGKNPRVLSYVRRLGDEAVLVVANLSRYTQFAPLDLSPWRGRVPVEAFGGAAFPVAGKAPYPFTLGPHEFHWFALEAPAPVVAAAGRASKHSGAGGKLPVVTLADGWEGCFEGVGRRGLEAVLPEVLRRRSWFGGAGRAIQSVEIVEAIALPGGGSHDRLLLTRVQYVEGPPETYCLPVTLATGGRRRRGGCGEAVLARLRKAAPRAGRREALLLDATRDKAFAARLLDLIVGERNVAGRRGRIVATAEPGARRERGAARRASRRVPSPRLAAPEESHTLLAFDDRWLLKLYRRVDDGVNPDLELGRHLTRSRSFTHTPAVLGALEYHRPDGESMTLATLQRYVANQGTAWDHALGAVARALEDVLAAGPRVVRTPPRGPEHPVLWMESAGRNGGKARTGEAPGGPAPREAANGCVEAAPDGCKGKASNGREKALGRALEGLQRFAADAGLLGRRTAQMHLALAASRGNPALAPQPFTELYQRSLLHGVTGLADRAMERLRGTLGDLAPAARRDARVILGLEKRLRGRLRAIHGRRLRATRIRCHGDFHLGQVLFTGEDFVIVDFEGEPSRTLHSRRTKTSPLRDAAGMLRSFHYAAFAALLGKGHSTGIAPSDFPRLEPWAAAWNRAAATAFLDAWLPEVRAAGLLPGGAGELRLLAEFFLLEKSLHELCWELEHRPAWTRIALRGLRSLLESAG